MALSAEGDRRSASAQISMRDGLDWPKRSTESFRIPFLISALVARRTMLLSSDQICSRQRSRSGAAE